MDDHVLNKAIDFQRSIDYSFKDRDLLLAALVRKSYLNEHPDLYVLMRQEALSNIGDAVIDLLATEHLVHVRRMEDKGAITEERQSMVKREKLNVLAAPMLRFFSMGQGEVRGQSQSSIPGECLEAVVGALYLDGGLSAAKALLTHLKFFESES